ncbi:hypothetical protein CABS02_15439 [Colletotrichum abscissum]|uniref:Uncharacterized protein n=1 Tax=Colletotrichum abscissum TaxID=1671311 RepID=A0A9P9WZ75_9PEZI|nr:hypothetical protein CABS02_15439 [Colletotrichum abscissum]
MDALSSPCAYCGSVAVRDPSARNHDLLRICTAAQRYVLLRRQWDPRVYLAAKDLRLRERLGAIRAEKPDVDVVVWDSRSTPQPVADCCFYAVIGCVLEKPAPFPGPRPGLGGLASHKAAGPFDFPTDGTQKERPPS